jgi:ATP-dependent helicase/nuclease subunit A
VLAPPAKGALNWLKVLDDPGGSQYVNFPAEDDNLIRVGAETFVADVRPLVANEAVTSRVIQRTHVRAPTADMSAPRPLHLRPSEAQDEVKWAIVESINLGGRLRIDGVTDIASLGEAVHAILAYDDPVRSVEIRRADAQATLERWGIQGFSAVDAIEASDRLHAALAGRWPGAKLTREVPVAATLGDQLVHGRIDLLAETLSGFAIIDHKSFPGAPDLWTERALQYAPQLALYADAVQAATGRLCDELFVHLPIVGALLRLARAEGEPVFPGSAEGLRSHD